jgi:HD-GYP domain-containing protein (c-di-GMP phosphodiesterase class II)
VASALRVEERSPAQDPAAIAYLRKRGRDFIVSLYGALRAIKLYPVEHTAVQKTLAELAQVAREIVEREHELELRMAGEFLFINSTRLRLDLTNYATFGYLLRVCKASGVGAIRVHSGASPRDWLVLLSMLDAQTTLDPSERLFEISEHLAKTGVGDIEVFAPAEEDDRDYSEEARQAANRTYNKSVAVTREVINSVRMGRTPSIRKIKRVVQGIVDQILNEETSLIGLTAIRDYDEYTFTHSVNVCIFAVALGRKLGLTRIQLYDLGLGALMHDIGKARVALDVLNKPGSLTDDEWRAISAHPWQGVLQLFQMRGRNDIPYRAMVIAFEHHMKTDLTGYPKHRRPREMSIYSKIVAVADAFDAATSRRAYQATPFSPSDALGEMRVNPRRGMDPVLVKAFTSLVGHYPVGTMVVLDTFELALVHSPSPSPDAIARPMVQIISDTRGNVLFPGVLTDLTERDENGTYRRTIIKISDPDRYGIRISDYFV